MKVREVMSKNIISFKEDTTLKEAAQILVSHNISGAPLVDRQGKLIGIVSEKDIFKKLYPDYKEFYQSPEFFVDFEELEKRVKEVSSLKIKEIASKEVITVRSQTPIMRVGAIMLARGIHRLPVVNDQGKLVGIVSRRDIFKNIFKKYLKIKV
jgi:CBS domain-containing protein